MFTYANLHVGASILYVHVYLDVLVNLNHVVHHYVHVVVNLAWAYVIVTANLEDYVVVLVFRCVLVYPDVLAYQFVLAAVAHLVHARVSVTHHRVLAIVVNLAWAYVIVTANLEDYVAQYVVHQYVVQ